MSNEPKAWDRRPIACSAKRDLSFPTYSMFGLRQAWHQQEKFYGNNAFRAGALIASIITSSYGSRMSLIENERTKLTANWLNAMASGVIITGVVAPSIALLFQLGGGSLLNLWIIGAASCVWLFFGIALHLVARRSLRRLS